MEAVKVGLAALYLRGLGPSSVRKRWPLVLGALQSASVSGQKEAVQSLVSAGLPDEASTLHDGLRWAQAEALVSTGRVLTAACEGYPVRWRRVLGASAPAALWCNGNALSVSGMAVAVVGSRVPSDFLNAAVRACVADLGAMQLAHIVSGGARGVDARVAEEAIAQGLSLTEILPAWPGDVNGGRVQLSVNPHGSSFGAGAAMERNGLIYAMADFAVVFGPRFRAGGTWHGAAEALRRRLCRLFVCSEPDNLAARALIALGADPYDPAEGLLHALAQPARQPPLPLAEPW